MPCVCGIEHSSASQSAALPTALLLRIARSAPPRPPVLYCCIHHGKIRDVFQLPSPVQLFHKSPSVAPARLHLDVEFEKHFSFQHPLDPQTRRRPDLLQHPAPLADQDPLLSFAFAINRGRNPREPRTLLEVIDDHGCGVGYLFFHLHENLLADNFCCHKARRLVSNLILRKIRGTCGQRRNHLLQHLIQTVALKRRNRKDLREVIQLAVLLNHRQQPRLVSEKVNFVQDKKRARTRLLQQVHCKTIAGIKLPRHIHQYQHQIAALQCLTNFDHHLSAKRAIRFVDARCIDENYLSAIAPVSLGNVKNSLNAIAGGLRLRRNDRELLPHQRIEQRRLARVGPSENTNKTRTKWHRIGASTIGLRSFSSANWG